MIKDPEGCAAGFDTYRELILKYSGKSLQKMGLFQDCLNYQTMKYGLLLVLNKTTLAPLGIQMGLCLPKACQTQQVEALANQAFKNMSLPIVSQYVQSPQQFNPSFNAAFYITTFLLGLFTLLLLISTIWSKIGKKSAIIGSFNLKRSMHTFQYKQHKFNVFNGIKAICMMWVILGHMYSVRIQNIVNAITIGDQVQVPIFLVMLAAFFAVDVFFYIGGFLVAYSFLRNTMKSIVKYPLSIVHRVLRFWPSYIMAMLIYYSIIIHTGSGPLWYKLMVAGQIQNCQALWKPIIFVDNIVDNGQSMCMGWGWYLQNDMQIFIISIPILFLYTRSRKWSFITIWLLVLGSIIYNFVQVQVHSYVVVTHRSDFAKWNSYFPNVYIKPWTRCPPYLYGLTLGLLYMEFIDEEKNKKQKQGFFKKLKNKLQASKVFKNGMQFLGLFIIFFIIFIPRTLQANRTTAWPQVLHSIYLTFTKLFFVMGVSMLVTPALLGIKNDWFFFLMDTKLFNFIAKISFWTYLIHYMVIEHASFTQKVDYYYNIGDIFTLYFPVALIAMFFGFIGTVLIQAPFAKLQKMLFEGKKKHKHGQKDGKHEQEKQKIPYKLPNLLNQSVRSDNSTQSTLGRSTLNNSITEDKKLSLASQ